MAKGKFYGFGLIASLVFVLIGSYLLFNKNSEASATMIVREGDGYVITLKSELASERLDSEAITIKDDKGNVVEAKLSLDKSGKVLTVNNLPVGTYKITVASEAYANSTKLHRTRTFNAQIMAKVEKITSKEELKNYFSVFLAAEKAQNSVGNQAEREESASSSDVALENSASIGSSGHSTTNNQVEGIEEGDITVTDGAYIYTLKDNRVVIIDAKNMQVVKRITVGKNEYPSQVMLHEKTLIIVRTGYVEIGKEPYYDGKSVTRVSFYDVTDAKNPKLVREVGQDGDVTNVRKLGNYLYVVSSRTPNYWMMEQQPNMELRPSAYDGSSEQVLPFDQIRMLPESNQPNYLLVSAIDVSKAGTAEWKTESFLGNSGQLYMSEKAIYVASMNYNWQAFTSGITESETVDRIMAPQGEGETTIYKIAIDKTMIDMVAEGKVKGSVLNQFSMDEHNGYFRIATTEGNGWGADANSKNHLFILDNQLKQVGAVNDLAQGERIYSARFMGDKAYIVTFKETDPLFVIDTKNPQAPKVLGELKIPGFSNYLHPIGENHLLGIGNNTEVEMVEGSKDPVVLTKGMKLSLFNITDFNNPVEQQAVIIGGRGTYSPIQHDHKALFRDSRNSYYGFPITIYDEIEDEYKYEGTGAHIYKVTASGIELAGELMEQARPGEQYEDSYNTVQRIIYVDDKLYTVSRSKVTSYNGKTFKKIDTLGF